MKLRETPCDRCGWKYPGDHVCIDLSTAEARAKAQRVVLKPAKKKMPEAQRTAISESRKDYWAAYRESNRLRDASIVAKYNAGGVSQPALAQEFGISQSTIQKILKQAAVDGLTQLRRKGSNIRHGDVDIRMEA